MRRRWGLAGAAAAVVSLAGAAPASASWSGSLTRASTDPSSGDLVLTLTASAPSYGLNFGLNLSGYAVSAVSANQQGPMAAAGCTPSGRSDATGTHNPGVDCSFQSQVTQVTITFTTSPRYPDNGGGKVYDQQDTTVDPVSGPAPPFPLPPTFNPPDWRKLKQAAAAAEDWRSRALLDCQRNREFAQQFLHTPGAPFAVAILENSDCKQEADAAYQNALALADPVDQNFSAVALPSSPSIGTLGADPCRKVAKRLKAACRSLSVAAARRAAALARSAALWEAIDTTLNRLNTAKEDGSDVGQQTQGAALEAYEGELIAAAAGEDAANAAVARELAKLGIHPKLSAKQVSKAARAIAAGHPSGPLAHALAALGINKKAFGNALKTAFGARPGAFDLISVLRTKSLTPSAQAGLRSQLKLLTPWSLIVIVNGLTVAGAIDQATNRALEGDANKVQQAPDATSRAAAVHTFIDDAQRVHGEAGTLLGTAGRVLL